MQRKRSAPTLSHYPLPKGVEASAPAGVCKASVSHRGDGQFVSDSKTVPKNGCLQIKAQSQQRLFARNEMSCASRSIA